MEFFESFVYANVADSLRAAALKGKVEVALWTLLESEGEWLFVRIMHLVWLAFISLFA